MNKRKPISTTTEEIVKYWADTLDESELSVDFADADKRCWRCAYKSKLEKCHIVPHSLNGEDTPDNLVLLCRRCHREAPNVADKEYFWDWLKAQKVHLYDTYWIYRGMKEYHDIYQETIEDSMVKVHKDIVGLKEYLTTKFKFVTIHFGEGRLNPSTIAGLMRAFIKDAEEKNRA